MALISNNKLAGDILFIGVGLGGCRVVNSIQQLGYECYYINTAIGDFDNLIEVDHDMTYPIPKSKGCNKNMGLAYSYVADYISDIYNKIDSNYRKYQHIMFVFSAGGGTGAGSGPALAEYFAQQYQGTKSVSLTAILPSKSDNAESAANAQTCLNYIYENCTTVASKILLDNEGEDKFTINDRFAEQIDYLLALPECKFETKTFKLADERETLSLLATPGYVHLATISAPTKIQGDNEPYIINSLPYSVEPNEKGCLAMAVSIADKKLTDFNPDHLYGHFGRPNGDIKAGTNKSSYSYVYVFGTEYPEYLMARYDQWLDEFEKEAKAESKKHTFEIKSRSFLTRNTASATTSTPFTKSTGTFEKSKPIDKLPALPKENPFAKK